MNRLVAVLLFVVVLALPVATHAAQVELKLEGGAVVHGALVEETPEHFVLSGPDGKRFQIARAAVQEAKGLPSGTFTSEASTPVTAPERLLLGPTARMPGPGRGYVAQTGIMLTQAEVGLGESASLSVRSLLPIAVLGVPQLSLGLKAGGAVTERLNLAVGLETLSVATLVGRMAEDPRVFGFAFGAYAVATYGTERTHATLLVGAPAPIGFSWREGMGPFAMLGGQLALGEHYALVTENWAGFILLGSTTTKPVLANTLALRAQWGHWALDLGAIGSVQARGALPWVSATYVWR